MTIGGAPVGGAYIYIYMYMRSSTTADRGKTTARTIIGPPSIADLYSGAEL